MKLAKKLVDPLVVIAIGSTISAQYFPAYFSVSMVVGGVSAALAAAFYVTCASKAAKEASADQQNLVTIHHWKPVEKVGTESLKSNLRHSLFAHWQSLDPKVDPVIYHSLRQYSFVRRADVSNAMLREIFVRMYAQRMAEQELNSLTQALVGIYSQNKFEDESDRLSSTSIFDDLDRPIDRPRYLH